jgi:hypothetical protein
MDNQEETMISATNEKPQYEAPMIKVMDESEVLTAFQVTAAGGTMWWASG